MEEVLETFTWPEVPPLQISQRQFFEFWPANVPYKAFWGMSSGQVNVTRMGFAESIR